jgi:predicted Rossmann-fold nucleotide-binding protein
MNYREIESQKEFKKLLQSNEKTISKTAFQKIDMVNCELPVIDFNFSDCVFLACLMSQEIKNHLENNNFIFPDLDVPFNVYPNTLYSKDDLYGKYNTGQIETYANTYDKTVYDHFIKTGKEAQSIKETLARRLHDHSITDALYDFLESFDERKVIAIMGGHNLARNTEDYKAIAKLSKQLTELGFLMVSGGGPGAMEATHLGAWFAGRTFHELVCAFDTLDAAPLYTDELWLDTAMQVINDFPKYNYESLGIPTWLYGHEPPTPFASKIAKYFANSVREDGLLTIAKGGIIFSPGSAGTIQEIFQEVTQNHYLSFGYASPMIFMNKTFWTYETPVYNYLQELTKKGKLKNLILSIHDEAEPIIKELINFSSVKS